MCIGHSWAYNLSDGSCVDGPSLEAETFEVRVEGDHIQIRLPHGQ